MMIPTFNSSQRRCKMKTYQDYLKEHRKKHSMSRHEKRDTEKGKVYASEWATVRKLGRSEKFESIEDAQKFVNKVVRSATWKKLTKRKTVYVFAKARNGRGNLAMAYGSSIVLDTVNGMTKFVILHELAHCANAMHHGRTFRNNILALIGRFLGAEWKNEMKAQYKKRKLRIGNAPKPMPRKLWEARSERMAAMRMKRDG